MWIERDIESSWEEICQAYPIVVVTGSRQVGKTSLLEHLVGADNLVSLDLPSEARRAETTPEQFIEGLRFPAIIDEVQYAPSLFRYLKHLCDRRLKKTGERVFLTGSERFVLMRDLSESLAGRAGLVELSGLSLRELERATGQSAAGSTLITWMLQGGYPGFHAVSLSRERFFSNLVATYIERDVKRLGEIRDARDFDRFLRLCAVRTGQILSMNAIAAEVGVSQTTIKRWVSILQASAIVDIVEPWFSNATSRLIKRPKLYFRDTGLCTFLMGLDSEDALIKSPHLGPVFETLCYNQIRASYDNRAVRGQIFYFRTKDGAEIDFVIPKGPNSFDCFECKWSEHPKFSPVGLAELEKATGGSALSFALLNTSRQPHLIDREHAVFALSAADAGHVTFSDVTK